MTKAGERLIAAAQEAVRVAKGEEPAARMHFMEHHYETEGDVRAAFEVVQRYLREEFIVDGCREVPALGCASCQAIRLERDLELFKAELPVPRDGNEKARRTGTM